MIENNHEPIISKELWDKVREYNRSVSRGKRDSNGYVSPFSGLLYCADCGYKMKRSWITHKNKEREISYICGYHSRFGKNYCSTHTIKESTLEEIYAYRSSPPRHNRYIFADYVLCRRNNIFNYGIVDTLIQIIHRIHYFFGNVNNDSVFIG